MEDKFWQKVTAGPEGCWNWNASHSPTGYARIGAGGRKGKTLYAHRVSYELFVGSIPEGMQLDHLCRNRGCVNPAHLEPVTQRENILRGNGLSAKYARRGNRCLRGHLYDEENTYLRPDNGKRQCKACTRIRARSPRFA
jgi:hypothetical protein